MKKSIFLLAALLVLFRPNLVQAEEKFPVGTPEQFASCDALKDPDSYKEHDSFSLIMPGKNGHFFRTSQDLTTKFDVSETNLDLLTQTTKALRSKGVDLVIAFMPTKGIAGASMLPDSDSRLEGYDPKAALNGYVNLIKKMNGNGINFVGTPDAKSGAGYFYKADFHWTSDGAREMAQAVADHIKKLPSYASLRKTKYKNVALPDGDDEQKFDEPLRALCGLNPEPEVAHLNKTVPVQNGTDANALFDNLPDPEVVLVGTSNSNRPDNDLNFSGRLQEFLSADVYNAAVAGGGIDDALIAYLASPQFKKNPPKIIVWEMPGYYNFAGDDTTAALRQILPAVYGECDSPLATVDKVELSSSTTLFQDLETKIDSSKPYYLAGRFSREENQKMALIFTYDTGKSEKFKINKRKSYPSDNSFYYVPKTAKGKISSVEIEMKENNGADVGASLCALPEK